MFTTSQYIIFYPYLEDLTLLKIINDVPLSVLKLMLGLIMQKLSNHRRFSTYVLFS